MKKTMNYANVNNEQTTRRIENSALKFTGFVRDAHSAIKRGDEARFELCAICANVLKAYADADEKHDKYSVRAFSEATGLGKTTVQDYAQVHNMFPKRDGAYSARASYTALRVLSRKFKTANEAEKFCATYNVPATISKRALEKLINDVRKKDTITINSDANDGTPSPAGKGTVNKTESIAEALTAIVEMEHILEAYTIGADNMDGNKMFTRLSLIRATLKSFAD